MVTTNKNIDSTIFAMKSQGLSTRQIAERLNSEKVLTAQGKKWTVSNVANRLYPTKSKQAKTVRLETSSVKSTFVSKVLALSVSKKEKLDLLAELI